MSAGELDGVRALVTGGASGIGRAVARALRQRGAAVASLDLRDGVSGGGERGLKSRD